MATNEELLALYSTLRRKLSIEASAVLKCTGLGIRQFMILKSLSDREEVKVSELAGLCMTDRGTVSRSVAQLQDAGLIKKSQSPEDGRIWTVQLTKKGRAVLPKINDVYSELSRRCFSHLKEEEKRKLGDLLQKVADRIGDFN